MSKVIIIWFNFSSSTSYPSGPVSSGMSIYRSDITNKEIGVSKSVCNCGCIKKRSINVTNRHNTYLDIRNIRTLSSEGGQSAVDDLKIDIFYKLLRQIIKDMYPNTFDFEGQNMAIRIDDSFDELTILEKFKEKLMDYYIFDAPINMTEVATKEDVATIPFMNIDDACIDRFTAWLGQNL
jgi:hypothetical protein